MKTCLIVCLACCLSLAAGRSFPLAVLQDLQEEPSVDADLNQDYVYIPYVIVPWPNKLSIDAIVEDSYEDGDESDDDYQFPVVHGTDEENSDVSSDDNSSESVLTRNKRQARDIALDLALDHQDRDGNDRAVGRPYGRIDLDGSGQDARNFHVQGGVGAGSVLWRSDNGRHSVGAGVYASQGAGRSDGFGYRTRPNFGGGFGYEFKF